LRNHSFQTCDLSGWVVKSGNAFSKATITNLKVAPDHNVWFNQSRRQDDDCLLWGYQNVGDAAVGEMYSQPFVLGGDGFINFLIGGGEHPQDVYIALIRSSDQKELFRATGSDSEEMMRVGWDAKAHLGETLYLKVVDKATGGWGHITLDDINVPTR
jgi:hypothetical protein